MSPMSRETYWPLRSFGPSSVVPGSADLLPRLSASGCLNGLADSTAYYALRWLLHWGQGALRFPQSRHRDPAQTSRGKFDRLHRAPAGSTTRSFDGWGLRGESSARPTRAASYPVSVRRVAASLHASFRPRLAATPLRFARTSPPSGCAGDLHPQAVEHARHTTKPLRGGPKATPPSAAEALPRA